MARFGLTLAHQDDHGITTATSWALSEEDYKDIMEKALEVLGPSHGNLMADPGGGAEISRSVRDNSVEF